MVNRFYKPALYVALGVAVSLPWILAGTADGGSGACQHHCRCSRLEYFDRLLPKTLPGHSGDALGEVQRTVGLLLADPGTDWSHVRVARLRERLADLNVITLYAEAEEVEVPGGLDVSVAGDERTLEALRRVVPEHAQRMDGFRGWHVSLNDDARDSLSPRGDQGGKTLSPRGDHGGKTLSPRGDQGGETLRLSIRADDAGEVEIVRAMGFFGFLASGVHRPQSNLAVARGVTP